jgi:hypothetical protein
VNLHPLLETATDCINPVQKYGQLDPSRENTNLCY